LFVVPYREQEKLFFRTIIYIKKYLEIALTPL
jgi:hypothetical protein